MRYVLKLWLIIILPLCVYTDPSEDIDSLVSEIGQNPSNECKHVSVDVTWRNSDSEFSYKKEKVNEKDTHVFKPNGSNKIASIYKNRSLVWQADNGMYCKLVHAHKPTTGSYSITGFFVINGKEVKKSFVSSDGLFYESGTVCLNINQEKGGDDYKFVNEVKDKNGDLHWTANEGKKITLVMMKSLGSSARLFWKSTGNWYCKKVTATKVSDKINKLALEITDGTTTTNLVLIKQGKTTWVPENTVSLNTEKKEAAPNCKYTTQVKDKKGEYFYEPLEGFNIMRVSHGSKKDPDKLVWQSPGNVFCTKVTGTVESDKTTMFLLDLKDEKETKFQKKFVLCSKVWVEANSSSSQNTPKAK